MRSVTRWPDGVLHITGTFTTMQFLPNSVKKFAYTVSKFSQKLKNPKNCQILPKMVTLSYGWQQPLSEYFMVILPKQVEDFLPKL